MSHLTLDGFFNVTDFTMLNIGPKASKKTAFDVVPLSPLEPFSSDCRVVPLAAGGGERSSVVTWSLGVGRSEVQHT